MEREGEGRERDTLSGCVSINVFICPALRDLYIKLIKERNVKKSSYALTLFKSAAEYERLPMSITNRSNPPAPLGH
jgi:hypothetical protein